MDPAKMAQLKELASMKDSGILSEAEFATQKAALLAVAPQAPPIMPVQATMQGGMMQPGMMHGAGHDDAAGHDAAGHDAAGHDAAGHDAAGHDAAGHDAAGHDDGQPTPPPPGCPPGGQFVMVKYHGPATKQAQAHTAFCCILGFFLPVLSAALLALCPPQDLKDEKEVYQVNGTCYTLNGTVDTNVVCPAGLPQVVGAA